MAALIGLHAINVEPLPVVGVGPVCARIDLPSTLGAKDRTGGKELGSIWPDPDCHVPAGESVFVLKGEVIEGDAGHLAGTSSNFRKKRRYRPRTAVGVQLVGFNLVLSA